jgi:uncharacterized BrkB/YihY/UPF0761 family membrane protein
MNVGLLIVALLIVGGSIFGIFAIAANSQQTAYTDSFGAVSSPATNNTTSLIGNTTGSLTGAGGGIALVIAVFLVFIAAFFVMKGINFGGSSGGRR